MVSAPRLTAPRSTLRRLTPSTSVRCSVSTRWSIALRGRNSDGVGVRSILVTTSVRRLAAGTGAGAVVLHDGPPGDHSDQTLRHQQCQHDVNEKERHNRRHTEKMDESDGLETAEQSREFGKLHRLP